MGSEKEPKYRPSLTPLPGGPLIYENDLYPESGKIFNSRGAEITCGRKVKLCRCGASKNMPFCDKTHEKIGFTGENVSDRRGDRRRNYIGKRITIHDNRHICAHARFCVDGLPSVFREEDKPWIDPEGADIEQIIETIERCPSGALSYTIDGVEHRDLEREPRITVSRNGPYCVEGNIEVVVQVPRADQVSKEHCSLCRCGASKNMPFCDGSHLDVGFEDDKN